MDEYILNIEMDYYGPYHSEDQARLAQFLFVHKHPDMARWCSIAPITSESEYLHLIDPHLLH